MKEQPDGRRLTLQLPLSTLVVLFIKNLLFTVLVPGVVAVYVPFRLATSAFQTIRSPWGGWQLSAVLPLLVGAAIYGWCLWDFAVRGRGTPAPIDAPKHLVVAGLYRYIRNPMYVGVLLVIFGWAIFFRSRDILIYGAVAALVFHFVVILVEEPMLRAKFGDQYRLYCGAVGRWVPRFGRKKPAK